MAKVIKTRNRGSFTVKLPSNKKISFRTPEAFSNAMEVISRGRYTGVGELHDRIKKCVTGFEFVESEHKLKEFEKRFNGIEI